MKLTKYEINYIFTNAELDTLICRYLAESKEQLPSYLLDSDEVAEICRAHFDDLRDKILDTADALGIDLYSWDDYDKYDGCFEEFLKVLKLCFEDEMKYID